MNFATALSLIDIIAALLFSSTATLPPIVSTQYEESHAQTAFSPQTTFTPGNIVVCRVGNCTGTLNLNAAPVFLDEYSPSGTLVNSTALPTAASGSNKPLTLSGSSPTECQINASANGTSFVLAGYAASPGTASVGMTQTSTVPRVLGRVDIAGAIDTSTTTTSFNFQSVRSATSDTGTGFWATGQGSGVVYQANGLSGAATTVAANPTMNGAMAIAGGQLYTASTGPSTLAAVGTGLPTTSGQTITPLSGSPGGGQPMQFFFADLDPTVAGNDTLYVADLGTGAGPAGGGVKKFSLQSSVWNYTGTFPADFGSDVLATQFMGLCGTISGSTVTLFATRVNSQNRTQLIKLTDATGYGAMPLDPPILLNTAQTNMAFRGVAMVPPAPNPGTVQLSSNMFRSAENAGTLPITVTRSGGSTGAVSIFYTLGGGNATGGASCTAGVDYKNAGGVINFAANDTAPKTINVPLCNDAVYEGDETFTVTLSSPTGGVTLGTPSWAVATIVEDETAPLAIQFSSGSTGGYENSAKMQFLVSRTGSIASNIGATITFGGGTATKGTDGCAPGVDYYTTQTTVSIAANDTFASYFVNLCDDSLYEGDETFTATLSDPTGGAIMGSPATMTFIINENDPSPLSGTVNVGAGQTYPTLDSLFTALNQLGLKGDLDVNIVTDVSNEPGNLTGLLAPTEYLGSGYTITIRPSGGMRTISGASAQDTPLIFMRAPRVHIDGAGPTGSPSLLFRNTSLAQNTLSIGGDGVTVENCIFEAGWTSNTGISEHPIVAVGGVNQQLLFSGNLIRGRTDVTVPAGSALNVFGPANIVNNDISYAVAGVTTANNSQNVVISGNRLTGSQNSGSVGINMAAKGVDSVSNNLISTANGVGIKLDMNQLGQGGNATVNGNRLFNARNGILAGCKPGAQFTISNNFLGSVDSLANTSSRTGIELRQIDGCTANVDYNTVYLRGDRSGSGDTFAFYADSINIGMNLSVRNNIFFNGQTGGPGVRGAAYLNNIGGTTLTDYNFFAGTGTPDAAAFMQYAGGGWMTLSGWQGASARDFHSIADAASSFNIANMFVDSANGDLHLKPTAGSILNAGTPLATVTSDVDGETRSPSKPDIGGDEIAITAPHAKAAFDFDGDGKTDETVFRPSNGVWYLNRSQAGFTGYQFGASSDLIAPADFTGDGKTDTAVFRPSTGTWFILRSDDSTFVGINFGSSGDIPAPADYDGDGKADTAVFRPSAGTWFIQRSNAGFMATAFGTNGDVPTVGDFDGDGKADVAVFRASNGVWYRLNSSNGSFFGAQFGQSGDKVVAADYSGDGKADLAIYRPTTGTWYIQRSQDGSFYGQQFGSPGDLPAPGDYDGDGKADVAVFRPNGGTWFEQRSTVGFAAVQFGANGDKPGPNAFTY